MWRARAVEDILHASNFSSVSAVLDSMVALVSVLLGLEALHLFCACNAREWRGRPANDAEQAWEWEETTAGEHPHQALPPRLPDGVSLRIVILTIGTRGDVQPMVTLGQGLQEVGHSVCIATHECFRSFILARGLEYHPIGFERLEQPDSWRTATSVGAMMEDYLEHVEKHFHSIGDHYLNAIRPQDPPGAPQADLIVTTNHTLSFGVNLSEATGIPCWVAKVVPDSPTRAFAPPGERSSSFGWYNYWLHMMFWVRVVLALHRTPMQQLEYTWRKRSLGLPKPAIGNVLESSRHLPSLLGYSHLLFPTPDDYPEWHFPCGFWMSDERDTYEPPPELEHFLSNSRRRIVVVNFGSMVHSTSGGLVDRVALQVLARRCKCLVISGWSNTSDLLLQRSKKDKNLMIIPGAPHEYVFQYVHAVVHHGGAGTTARVLASGAVSVIVPILRWADQPQWAERVVEAGVGVAIFDPNPNSFQIRCALDRALDQRGLERKANILSATVRAEPSIRRSVDAISSCICSMMLAPAEHFAILHYPLPNDLSAKQRMCLRHCVHCHVLRKRHARAFALQDTSGAVPSPDANGAGEEPLHHSSRVGSRAPPQSHRLSHPGHAPAVLRPIAWQLLDSRAVQAEQLLRTMHQAAMSILRPTRASLHLSDEVRMLLHLTQTERDILHLPPPPSSEAHGGDTGKQPSPEPWEQRFIPRRSALKRYGSADILLGPHGSKERLIASVLRGSHSNPPVDASARRHGRVEDSEGGNLAFQNGTPRASRLAAATPRGSAPTSPGMALLSPSVGREGDRPPSSYRDLYSARRSVLRPLQEEDFESPASSMRTTGRTPSATPAGTESRRDDELSPAIQGATARQRDMVAAQHRENGQEGEEKNEDAVEPEAGRSESSGEAETDSGESSDDTASTRSRSLESARVLSRAVLSRLGKEYAHPPEEDDASTTSVERESPGSASAHKRSRVESEAADGEEENAASPTKRQRRGESASTSPSGTGGTRRRLRIARQSQAGSPSSPASSSSTRRKRAASKSASPSPATKRRQTRPAPSSSPPTTRQNKSTRPTRRARTKKSAAEESPSPAKSAPTAAKASAGKSPPARASVRRQSRRVAGLRRSARLRQSTRDK